MIFFFFQFSYVFINENGNLLGKKIIFYISVLMKEYRQTLTNAARLIIYEFVIVEYIYCVRIILYRVPRIVAADDISVETEFVAV